ncbi:MAG TPA: MFS transporter [Chloroflexota bacterium]|nr:MFS transporter [Chloroflexota bacterium]
MPPAEPRGRHALATLRHRDFRLLWGGLFVSTVGDQMQVVAIAWHIYVLTGSALQLGLVGAARAIPFLLLTLVGGAVADIMDRRLLLVWVQAVRMLTSAWLIFATFSGSVNVFTLYAVTFLTGAATAFDGPARQALVPNVVPADELASAYNLTTLLRQLATVFGPGLGGVLIGSAGLGWTYGANGISYLFLTAAVIAMKPVPRGTGSKANTWDLVVGGFRYAVAEPLVLWTLLIDLSTRALGNSRGLLPIFAKDVFLVGPEGLGWMNAALSGGAVAGSLFLGARGNIQKPVRMLLIAYAAEAFGLVCLGVSPVFWLAMLALFGTGVANVMAEVPRITLVQLSTPDELRGRVSALAWMFTAGGPQLGQMDAGAMASAWGGPGAAVIGGSAAVLSVVLLGIPLVKARTRQHVPAMA